MLRPGARELRSLVRPAVQNSGRHHHSGSPVIEQISTSSTRRSLREQSHASGSSNSAPVMSAAAVGTVGLASPKPINRRMTKQISKAAAGGKQSNGKGKSSSNGKNGGRRQSKRKSSKRGSSSTPAPPKTKDLTVGIPLGTAKKAVDSKVNSTLIGKLTNGGAKSTSEVNSASRNTNSSSSSSSSSRSSSISSSSISSIRSSSGGGGSSSSSPYVGTPPAVTTMPVSNPLIGGPRRRFRRKRVAFRSN